MNKKLNLFLINNKGSIDNFSHFKDSYSNINIISYLGLTNFKEIKSIILLFKCLYILGKINKSIFIYNDNFFNVFYRNRFYNHNIEYKFKYVN